MLRKSLRTIGLLCLPAALALGACNADGFNPGEREQPIINGTAATATQWPAAGALAYDAGGYWGFFCSATLIAPQWVLTAAHCVDPDSTYPASQISFYIGINANNPIAAQIYQVDAVHLHPGWDPDPYSLANDIALVHLASAVPAAVATPIPYNTAAVTNGQALTVVGYGVNVADGQGGGTGDGIKRYAYMSIAQRYTTWYEVDQNASDQLTCFGDSGGPDLVGAAGSERVAGVHSTVSGNLCNTSSQSTRVDAYGTWISTTMAGGGPTSCDMIGGDCATQACWFGETLNECLPSDNLGFGAACNPDPATWTNLPCRDGAGCFDFVEGAVCYEFCHTQADCTGAKACANVFSDVADLGLCVTSCNILGGTCAAGKACYPMDVDANGCFPSDGLGLDQACDPTPAGDNLPCGDGLICLQTGANENVGQCFEFCLQDNTCGAGNYCYKPIFTGIDSIGVCLCIDADEDNYCQVSDCNDNDATVNPGRAELCGNDVDDDCDGQTDEGCCPDRDNDGYLDATCGGDDCNDLNAATHPGAVENCNDSVDNDCDGVINEGCGACTDADGDGYCLPQDCNDQNAAVNPGAAESCADQVDNDCDGEVNENCGTCTDRDQDGYCEPQDCDDYDYWVNPGATDVCGDGIDQDCSGADATCGCEDVDQDGYADAQCGGDDCNDLDYWVNPGRNENCNDQIDNDCDGEVNEGCSGCTDRDGDGYCLEVDDCNDGNSTIHPGAAEACGDAYDNDCDGEVNEGCGTCTDVDGDGYCQQVDCDDQNAAVNPGAGESCADQVDNNCDGVVNEGCGTCTDQDQDGFCAGVDCDDLDFFTKPGATEMCGDNRDNDCDGAVDEGCGTCTDQDQDGACAADDCDDSDAGVYPGAAEICGDLKDNDCDGRVDETCDQPCQSAADCADLNDCTVDACGADQQCSHTVAPDFTPCGAALRGVCAAGQCVLPPPRDGGGCQTAGGEDPVAAGFGLLFLALSLGVLRRVR